MALKLVQPYLRDGNKTYYIRGTIRGQRRFESTGLTSKTKAQELCDKLSVELTDASIHGRKATVLFQEAVEHYRKQGGSRRFLGEYDERTDTWSGLIGHFWHRKLSTITQGDLDGASIALYPNANYHTRNRQCHTPFIAVWNKAHKKGWCEKRDWKRPRKAKGTMLKFKSKKTRAGTTATTYNRAWQFVSAMSPAPAMIMATFSYTGMRPIELYTLEAGQVSVEDRWIFLPESKTGKPRGIPMHEMLVPLFAGLKNRGGFMFRTPRGKPYEPKDEEGQGGGQIKTAVNGAQAFRHPRYRAIHRAAHGADSTVDERHSTGVH